MANRERGEVTLDVHGKAYTLKLTMNAACQLEDAFSSDKSQVSLRDVILRAAAGSARHIRGLFWAALQHGHAAEIVKPEQAGDLLERAGEDAVRECFQKLIGTTEPDARDVAKAGAEVASARPRRAQVARVGTGGRSRSTHAESA